LTFFYERQPRAVAFSSSSMYDEAGNVIETHELGRRFRFFFNSACGCQRIALG
jgi:hypothetical protein